MALIVFSVGVALSALGWMNAEAAEQAKTNRLPDRVVEKTRKQLQDYLDKADVKGVPLLDPTVDWDALANWPNRFVYQGRLYQVEISDLSGDEIRTLRSNAEIRPGMVVSVGYGPVTRGAAPATAKAIFPRASWGRNHNLATGKTLIWGDRTFGGTWKEVFSYDYYPSGRLHKFHWESRDSNDWQFEHFDRTGDLVGVVNPKGYFWNGMKVSQERFEIVSQKFFESGGVPGAPPALPTTRTNIVPLRR